MKVSWVKVFLLVPILSIVSVFVVPLLMYWHIRIYVYFLFTPVEGINYATHVYIRGKSGNLDVCKIKNDANKLSKFDSNTNVADCVK